MDASAKDAPVQNIGKYQVISKLGQGGMGVVYKAKDPKIDRVVAVKTITARMDSDPELRERFRLEARSAAQISHKNVITIFDYDEVDGLAYLVMEFLEGVDLKTKIDRREPMNLQTKLRIITEIAEGLGHAHRMGIVHRDVKPGNVFITKNGQVKILDFGLARVVSSELTRSGVAVGTPAYMSPEQLRAERVDQRSDIFSAGVVFYELLTYSNPFHGDSDFAISMKIVQADPAPVEALDPTVPPEVAKIIHRALQKDPARRYQSFDELLGELNGAPRSVEESSQEPREDYKSDGVTTISGRSLRPMGRDSMATGMHPLNRIGVSPSGVAAPAATSAPGRRRGTSGSGAVTLPLGQSGVSLPEAEAVPAESKAKPVLSAVSTGLTILHRIVDVVLIVGMLGMFAVFALEFVHSKKLDALWAIRMLHRWFDPAILDAATWFEVTWDPTTQSFFPAGLGIGLLVLKLLLGIAFHWTLDLIAKVNSR
jgi:serine/threonine protein kinase